MDRDRRVCVFAEAAAAALERGRTPAAVRLLAITMAEAVEAGHPEAAEAARERLLWLSPRHLVGNAADAAEAVRDPEISNFLRTVRRGLPFEEAELWADSRPADDRRTPDAGRPVGEQVAEWLREGGDGSPTDG